MALYRNIAGFKDPYSYEYQEPVIGSSFLQPLPGTTVVSPSLPNSLTDPAAWQQQREQQAANFEAELNKRYDWLMGHTYAEIKAAGYYVTLDNGSIFQWTDAGHTTSTSYLSIDWIQQIENSRGTAGALLLHMQEPAIAKDTAGYEGGGSSSWYQDNGVTDPTTQQVSDPIAPIQSLPPVISTGDGVQFQQDGSIPTGSNGGSGQPVQQPVVTINKSTIYANILPIAVLAGLGAIALAGEDIAGRKKNIFFIGGVGALFYLMVKKQ